MGAFSWKCVAPFGDDAQAVLVEAQHKALRERAYGKPYARGEPAAKSLAALRKAFPESGTCSVIDVTDVGPAPGLGIAGPFPRATLQRIFGTVRPPLEQVLDHTSDLFEELSRGMAAYVVTFENGKPQNVVFLGYSFD